jgi:hypothetical protein
MWFSTQGISSSFGDAAWAAVQLACLLDLVVVVGFV